MQAHLIFYTVKSPKIPVQLLMSSIHTDRNVKKKKQHFLEWSGVITNCMDLKRIQKVHNQEDKAMWERKQLQY